MQRLVFSVVDTVASVFSAPFLEVTRGSAIRAFSDAVNDPQNPAHKHPGDFDLFELGVFDDVSGTYELKPRPEKIAAGGDLALAPVK